MRTWSKGAVMAATIIIGVFVIVFYRAAASFVDRYYVTPSWDSVLFLACPFLAVCALLCYAAYRTNEPKSSWLSLALIVIIAAVWAAVPFSLMMKNGQDYHFEYNRWVSEPGKRSLMVDNMLRRYELEGMPRMDVVDLLGAPSSPADYRTGDELVYSLGIKPADWEHPVQASLVLYLDGDDQVDHYEIKRSQ
ncbi:hypothetical protein [Paenibacillus protaetiae]|uniref:Uncharacterized protein n=1 Tax=Paenibacillus protaetiae TaxID=2509456 RepID=A0A4V0YFK9_9BACL|nr:hypothetical protein [Paenibacillus protaetiae]QAY68071.1 hypothetical protein ET464_18560 [Paenibacillus protaetiae]